MQINDKESLLAVVVSGFVTFLHASLCSVYLPIWSLGVVICLKTLYTIKDRLQHWELHALLFGNSVWVPVSLNHDSEIAAFHTGHLKRGNKGRFCCSRAFIKVQS